MVVIYSIYIILFSKLLVSCETANILIAMPLLSKSQYSLLRHIGFELAEKHNVTIITANLEDNPPKKYRQIAVDLSGIYDNTDIHKPNLLEVNQLSDKETHDKFRIHTLIHTEIALKTPAVQNFLQEDQIFDVVVVNQFYNEAFNLLAHKYNCPLVLVSSFGNSMKHNIAVKNPLQLFSLYTEYLNINDQKFWSKIKNIYITIYEYICWRFWYLPKQEVIGVKYLNLSGEVPGLYDVEEDAALLLMNRYATFEHPVAYLPNLVEVGGLHLKEEANNLPKDLQEILDNSPQGVIYMSLGSTIQLSEFSFEQIKYFFDTFRQLKQTVLVKSEIELNDMPENVVVRKWFPQVDILAHPNMHLFITHAGLLSIQEALWHGVPLLAIPVFADQSRNAVQAQSLGLGQIVQPSELHLFREKLLEVLDDIEKYRSNAATLSTRFRDRSTSALSTAIFWIEHVIAHDGVNVRTQKARIHWFEYYDIDIIAIFVTVMVISLFFVKLSVIVLKQLILNTIDRYK